MDLYDGSRACRRDRWQTGKIRCCRELCAAEWRVHAHLGRVRSWFVQKPRFKRKATTPYAASSAQAVISEEVDFYTDGPDLINARLRGGQVKYFGGTMQQ